MSRLRTGLCVICSAALGLSSFSDARTAGDGAALLATVGGGARKDRQHYYQKSLLAAAEAASASAFTSPPTPNPAQTAAKDLRPGLGGGPDRVDFGIFVKSLGSMSEQDGTFSADVILLMRWQDQRTAALVPEGVETFTLASESAASKIWMPKITITNRIIKGAEVISSATSITTNGQVEKIERMVVICKNKFDLSAFPFDTQHLVLTIASTTMMSDELELTPVQDKMLSGVKKGLFDSYDVVLDKVMAESNDQVDGALKKSRGELCITVHRDWQLWMQKKLIPELFLVAISWSVFYFPLQPPFAMPRCATSLIAFLSMMTVSSSNNGGGGERWLDVFEEACTIMLFLTVLLNIFVEAVNYAVTASVAIRIDHELKLVLPAQSFVNYSILFVFHQYDVTWLSLISRIISVVGPVSYIAICFVRFREISDGTKALVQRASISSVDVSKSGSQA